MKKRMENATLQVLWPPVCPDPYGEILGSIEARGSAG